MIGCAAMNSRHKKNFCRFCKKEEARAGFAVTFSAACENGRASWLHQHCSEKCMTAILAALKDSLAKAEESAEKYSPDGKSAFLAGWYRRTIEIAIEDLERLGRRAA